MKKSNFKLDQETIIKHRFWFLLGLFVPLVLIILILNWTSLAGATTKAKADKEDVIKKLTAIPGQPPNASWLNGLEPRERKVKKKKKEIWEHAWQSQESLYVYPPKLAELKTIRFGKNISYDIRDRQINADIFNDELEKISKIVDPVDKDGNGAVQYLGGDWKNALGTEPTWTERPKSSDLWLASEDLWIKAGLLDVVKQCNDTVGTFHDKGGEAITALQGQVKAKQNEIAAADKKIKAPDAEAKYGADKVQELKERVKTLQKEIKTLDAKLKPLQAKHQPKQGEVDRATFTNRTWQLDLVLSNAKDGTLTLKGQITNISSRRQLLGLRFNVSLRGGDSNAPVVLRPDGEPLGPRGSVALKPVTGLRRGDAISGVQQVFNWLTVPVKRIDHVYFATEAALSSRVKGHTKLAAYNNPEAEAFAAAKAGQSGATGSDASSSSGSASSNGGQPDAGGFMDKMKQMREQHGQGSGVGSGGNPFGGKGMQGGQAELVTNRYLDQGQAVRRLPVALVVVIDQAYLQDLLTAVANSKLRIQITQVEWKHFPRDQSIEPPHHGEDTAPAAGSNPQPGQGSGGKRIPLMPSFTGGGGPGSSQQSAQIASSSNSDDLSANLIQVAIRGVASIYERYTPSASK